MAFSVDGNTIAVEIELPIGGGEDGEGGWVATGVVRIGDFFSFDASGLICRLVVY